MTSNCAIVSELEQDTLISALLNAAVDAVIVIDRFGLIRECSHSTSKLFGYTREELVGRNVSILMPEPDASGHDAYINNYVSSHKAKIIGVGRDVRGRKKSGDTFPMHLSVGESESNGERLFVGICHDLTDYESVLQQVAIAEQRYREILHSQKQFICRLDGNLRVTFANASFVRVLGIDDQDLVGCPITVFTDEQSQSARELLTELFRGESSADEISVKISMRSSQGAHALIDWTFRRTDQNALGVRELQGFGIDVSDKEKAIRQARYFRRHDALTGFLNKRSFVEAAKVWVGDHSRCAFLHFDCERFGLVNQRFGYEVGDAILIEAAARLKKHIRRSNLCCRIGADDFLIAVELENDENPLPYVSFLLQELSSPYEIDQQRLRLGVRVGIALFPDHSQSVENLPEFAESALLIAASSNGKGVAFFDPVYQSGMKRRLDIEQHLKQALQNDELEIYLQPKYWVDDKRLFGFEALIRWTDPELGTVAPGEFVPLAEQSVLGYELDKYVITKVLALIGQTSGRLRNILPIAVNITASHFSDPSFCDFLFDELAQQKIDPSILALEITEGVVMEHSKESEQNLARLRKAGIQIAIDDFGTGYSSLSYLRNLEVDELKIDRSFIQEIEKSEGAVLIRSIIQIAKAFGIRVVAEGVETQPQLEALQSMGCDIFQGYLLAKPLPAAQALNLVMDSQNEK